MPTAACPELAEFNAFVSGEASQASRDVLLEHLLRCEHCASKLMASPDREIRTSLIRELKSLADPSASSVLHLMERLEQNRSPTATKTIAHTPTTEVGAITFPCPECKKKLKVGGLSAGKNLRCPHCKHTFRVPGPSPDKRTLPAAGPATNRPLDTSPSGRAGDSTVGPDGNDPQTDLCAFLSPAQGPDELGGLGPYRVLKVLGTGGMGVVFRAEDPSLQRLVALKAMLPGMASGASARQRFLREARAAAAIKHDHIVSIYQVGEDGGVPFLAMEFLEGEPLDARVEREGKLPTAEVLRIGRETAEGLQAAHERGLIHRDIKPANLWLEGKRGRVKVLDFGLARAVDESSNLTQQGAIVGTPAYMSPEQVRGETLDHRSDLFSLGCVLYRLATGVNPFRGTDAISTLMAVASDTPKAPHELDPVISRPLSDFVMQLIEKEADSRPESALAVVERLREMGAGVVQQGVRRPARQKASKRSFPLALGAVVVLATLGGVGWFVVRPLVVTPEEKRPQVTEVKPGDRPVPPEIKDKAAPPDKKDKPDDKSKEPPRVPAGKSEGLDLPEREDIPKRELAVAGGGDPNQAPAELVAVFGNSRLSHWNLVRAVAFHPKGETLASVSTDGTLKIWDTKTGHEVQSLAPPEEDAIGNLFLVYSPDGRSLLCVGMGGKFKAWDTATGKELHSGNANQKGIAQAIFHPGGATWLTSGTDPAVKVWDSTTWQARKTHAKQGTSQFAGTLSPDGKWLVTAGPIPAIREMDSDKISPLTGGGGMSFGARVRFSNDSKVFAMASQSGDLQIWETSPPRMIKSLPTVRSVQLMEFRPDGKALAVVSQGNITLWDWATAASLHTLSGHPMSILCLAFSADGKRLASGSSDGSIKLWNLETGEEMLTKQGEGHSLSAVTMSLDGKRLAFGTRSGSLIVEDVTTGSKQKSKTGHTFPTGKPTSILDLAFGPDGRRLASNGLSVKLWSPEPLAELATVDWREGGTLTMAFDPKGAGLYTLSHARSTITLWNTETGKQVRSFAEPAEMPSNLAIHPDGKWLVVGNQKGSVTLWDTATGKKDSELKPSELGTAIRLAFSPDGGFLAVGRANKSVDLWDISARKHAGSLVGHRGVVEWVAFAEGGRTVVTAARDGTVRLWDVRSAKMERILQIGPPGGQIQQVVVCPDGRHLLTVNCNGTVYVLRLSPTR